ncbi:MAG: hypothetical protein QNJ72_44225 [Pleurocapsa sp. MO_226.B13]|nr:hypothetical protein [Pleurocapsa sp. MO_226.B13]
MLGKAKDATFELMDSVMTTRNVSWGAEFSRSPLLRRKWSSTYEAIQGESSSLAVSREESNATEE